MEAGVTAHSDALDLQSGVFKLKGAKAIATSLKCSAARGTRRKSSNDEAPGGLYDVYL
jgi:Protein of unknown function (DUF3175)